ncbi:hypothetical protein OG455_41235 [Kitasatospora sp. NBC_01287]|uniref:hypothetical protein n=1 Tax=Kitasatospora sp. NBC_01287 TaxID=2903573 RepID=UPI0022598E12|nr:hypothetical protein [Kitasatospora sp. NBC_01287]MCX4750907.1 hypothetical protein [Kitasatospora sp. NBC_01287]MCX4751866.1 hypothetical protein [Kitasatospora sp. NBC_01287]
MNTQQEMTEATLAAIAKASTNGITTATGLYSYDLGPLVQLVPVVTPARDAIPRVTATDGNPYAVWRAILNNTSAQPSPFMGLDYAANVSKVSEQDFQAKYMRSGMGGTVTLDAQDFSKGYSDANAVATFQTLNQVLIGDDRALVGAQSFPLARPAAPTLTQHATGGSIGAVQVYVGVAARTGIGYYYGTGNSQGNSANTTFGSGTTNSLTATVGAVRGAVCYDWFQSANGTTWYYYTTTTVNTVTMTSVISANNALPSGLAVPDLSVNWKGTANTVPTINTAADNNSGDPTQYDGLLASLSGDYSSTGQWVQSGTANTNPSTFSSLDGAGLTLGGGSINEFNQYLFLPLWNAVKCSPTALMMNAAQAQETATLILGSTGATTFLNTDSSGRLNVTAGGRVGSVINAPAGGIEVPIEVHPSVPPGTIVARTDRVPFPQANVSNVLEYRALRDTYRYDYASARLANTAGGGPRVDYEIESLGAFVNRAPVAMAVLSNVA